VAINNDDTDGDGIPDFADGYNLDGRSDDALSQLDDRTEGEQFVPIVLELPAPIDPTAALVRLTSGSDPLAVQVRTDDESGQMIYTPSVGRQRLWSEPGDHVRDGRDIEDGGDYIVPIRPHKWSNLAASGREVTLWLEALAPSGYPGDGGVTFSIDP